VPGEWSRIWYEKNNRVLRQENGRQELAYLDPHVHLYCPKWKSSSGCKFLAKNSFFVTYYF
jgi:hypothetical protein